MLTAGAVADLRCGVKAKAIATCRRTGKRIYRSFRYYYAATLLTARLLLHFTFSYRQ